MKPTTVLNARRVCGVWLVIQAGLLASAGQAHAQPTLAITPTTFEAGDAVQMTISGFTPGGYSGSINVDGTEVGSVHIPDGGARTFTWVTPSTITAGGHDIDICAACNQGDLEQRSNPVRVTVVTGEMTGSEFNLQVWGIEVSQGVRGDFARRTPPSGDLVLPPEDVVHVANRRTIVRVYPWVQGGPSFSRVTDVRARLWVSRNGTSYGPIESEMPFVPEIRADATIEDLRSDLRRTWNFVLPAEAVAVLSTEPCSFSLSVEINPSGPYRAAECATCFGDNSGLLYGNECRPVGQPGSTSSMTFRPHLVRADVDQPSGSVLAIRRPTAAEVTQVVRGLYEMLPIGDGARGINLMPNRNAYWRGTPAGWDPVQDSFLVANFLPGGTLDNEPPNDYYAFMYAPGGCNGHAFNFTHFLRTSVDALPCTTPAHEINHAIGARHAGNGHGEGGHDPAYPGSHGQVEADTWGLNVYDLSLRPPMRPGYAEQHDYMSYFDGWDSWVSRYTWDLTAQNLGTPAIDPGMRGTPALLASAGTAGVEQSVAFRGLVEADGSVRLAPFFATYPPDGGQGDGTYVLEFVDGAGQKLQSLSLRPRKAEDAESEWAIFAESISPPSGWQEMKLRVQGVLTQAWKRSAKAPSVAMQSPMDGFQWPNTGIRALTWDGQDSDGDPLVYRILGMHGPSGDLVTLAAGLTDETFDLDLSELPAGGQWTLLVETSDGYDRAYSQLVSGWVSPTTPDPMILLPDSGSVHVAGTRIPVMGLMADLHAPFDNANLRWYLDGVYAGAGTRLDLPGVPAGSHVLRLVTVNVHQLADSAEVAFQVVQALGAPELVSPSSGAQVQLPAVLEWEPVPGAISYRVQVASDPTFKTMVAEAGNLLKTGFPLTKAPAGSALYWRVMAEHSASPSDWSTPWVFTTMATTSLEGAIAGESIELSIFPNPMRVSTTIAYRLPEAGSATVEIFDPAGRRIRSLARGRHEAGPHMRVWDATDDQGVAVGTGIYLVRVTAPAGVQTRAATIVR